MTCYTHVIKDDINYEFVEKCKNYVTELIAELKEKRPHFKDREIKICREYWALPTVYRIETTLGCIYFCVETGGLIDYKSVWYPSGEIKDFLLEYLTGFYGWEDYFSPITDGEFKNLDEWASHHKIENLGRFVPSDEEVENLLDNFKVLDEEKLREKIYKLAILGYNSAFSNIFDDADVESWRHESWVGMLTNEDDLEVYVDCSDFPGG